MTKDGRAPDPAVLDRLADALAHRGPDGRGRHIARNIGMIHNRLAIIDLETGAQPLYEPGGAALVANAEIYNYVELRAALPQIAFATASDCEPALHLYRRDGRRFVEQLRGMYALALHDPAEDLLLLARDPVRHQAALLRRDRHPRSPSPRSPRPSSPRVWPAPI